MEDVVFFKPQWKGVLFPFKFRSECHSPILKGNGEQQVVNKSGWKALIGQIWNLEDSIEQE